MSKEWTLPQFRNFCHQQQFLAWQHRHSVLYGQGTATAVTAVATMNPEGAESGEFFFGEGAVLAALDSEGLTKAEPRAVLLSRLVLSFTKLA